MIVYKLTSPSGKSYIGITIRNLLDRIKSHCNKAKNSNLKIHNAINKYGIENFNIIILEENIADLEILKKQEKYYIEIYDTYKNGYNCTKGGDGLFGYKHSDKSNEKNRQSHLGKNYTLKQKQHLSKIRKQSYQDNPRPMNLCSGTIWINDGRTTKRIAPTQQIPIGFVIGRLGGWSQKKGLIWINNGQITKRIYKSQKIPNGYVLGRKI